LHCEIRPNLFILIANKFVLGPVWTLTFPAAIEDWLAAGATLQILRSFLATGTAFFSIDVFNHFELFESFEQNWKTFYVENKFVGNSFIAFTRLRPIRSEIPNLQLAASHVITYGYLYPDEGKMYTLLQLWKLIENSVKKWNIYERFLDATGRLRKPRQVLFRVWSITWKTGIFR
jgi:hypothetical protein